MMRKTINAVIADIQNQECITLKINGQKFDFIINDIVYAQYIRYKTIGLVAVLRYSHKSLSKFITENNYILKYSINQTYYCK